MHVSMNVWLYIRIRAAADYGCSLGLGVREEVRMVAEEKGDVGGRSTDGSRDWLGDSM